MNMFILSKIFLVLTDPGTVVLLLLLIATLLIWLRPRAGKWLLADNRGILFHNFNAPRRQGNDCRIGRPISGHNLDNRAG